MKLSSLLIWLGIIALIAIESISSIKLREPKVGAITAEDEEFISTFAKKGATSCISIPKTGGKRKSTCPTKNIKKGGGNKITKKPTKQAVPTITTRSKTKAPVQQLLSFRVISAKYQGSVNFQILNANQIIGFSQIATLS